MMPTYTPPCLSWLRLRNLLDVWSPGRDTGDAATCIADKAVLGRSESGVQDGSERNRK